MTQAQWSAHMVVCLVLTVCLVSVTITDHQWYMVTYKHQYLEWEASIDDGRSWVLHDAVPAALSNCVAGNMSFLRDRLLVSWYPVLVLESSGFLLGTLSADQLRVLDATSGLNERRLLWLRLLDEQFCAQVSGQ